MDGVFMHGKKGRMPFGDMHHKVIRVTARGERERWVYQFPTHLWRDAVRRVMKDTRSGRLPDAAAAGLLEMIAEAVLDEY